MYFVAQFIYFDHLIACRSGFYGVSCNKTCGKCLNNSACDPTSGACLNGCQYLWSGQNCKGNLYL